MKKLIFITFLALWTISATPWEFKGQNRVDPRIAGETPRNTAYDSFTPVNELLVSEPVKVIPATDDLRARKTIENDDPGYRSSVFDTPAMTK